MMEIEPITVVVQGPLARPTIPFDFGINPRQEAISFDTSLSGGYGTLRVGLLPPWEDGLDGQDYPWLHRAIEIPHEGHVEVYIGGSLVYEGVIINRLANRRGFEALGYGQWAGQFGFIETGGNPTDSVTSGVMYTEAVREVDWWVPGQHTDPLVQHTWDEIINRSSSDAITQFCSEGGRITADERNYTWMFLVYDGRVTRFHPQKIASSPRYIWSYDPKTMQILDGSDKTIDAVCCLYNEVDPETGSTYTRRTPWALKSGISITDPYVKKIVLPSSGTGSGAFATAQSHLDMYKDPQLSGTVKLFDAQYLRVRAGETAHIPGFGSNILTASSFSARPDPHRGALIELSATLGEPSSTSAAGFFQDVSRTVDAQRRDRDVHTGARRLARQQPFQRRTRTTA